MLKKIFVFFIISILFLVSACFATDTINMDLTNSISNNSSDSDLTTIDNANLNGSENLESQVDGSDTSTFQEENAPQVTTTTNYDDSGELSITNIINIILIVVGIVIILLGIAIIIKIK